MPSRMDGSKPPDWTGWPPSDNDLPEQNELSDSDSEGLWPDQQAHLDALLERHIPGDDSAWGRRHNREIRTLVRQVDESHRRDSNLRRAEREQYAREEREQREQQIRLRRYNDMQREIISINGMSNPTQDDINDLNDLILSSENLQEQITEYIRIYGFN